MLIYLGYLDSNILSYFNEILIINRRGQLIEYLGLRKEHKVLKDIIDPNELE
jgi:hypothetical protein